MTQDAAVSFPKLEIPPQLKSLYDEFKDNPIEFAKDNANLLIKVVVGLTLACVAINFLAGLEKTLNVIPGGHLALDVPGLYYLCKKLLRAPLRQQFIDRLIDIAKDFFVDDRIPVVERLREQDLRLEGEELGQ
jgi:hypothetical protein